MGRIGSPRYLRPFRCEFANNWRHKNLLYFLLLFVHDSLPMPATPEKSVSMGVRLSMEQRQELERISRETGVEIGQLIRLATEALLKHYRKCGNKLLLPLDFNDTIQGLLRQTGSTNARGLRRSAASAAGHIAADSNRKASPDSTEPRRKVGSISASRS